MRLDNFEEKIDNTILKRGLTYWENGQVDDLEQDGKKVDAWVVGTEDYHVELELEKEEIKWHSCTCPYGMGPVCKHIAAVLFELTMDAEEEEKIIPKRRGRPKKVVVKKKVSTKKKSKKPQFKTLIQEVNEEELRNFVKELATTDRKLKDRFMAFFANKWSEGNKEDYKIIFRNIMRGYTDRRGFLDYRNSGKFAREIESMMDEIPQWFATSPQNAFALCQAVVEESHLVYEEGVDDSSGEFGGLSPSALSYLQQLSEQADESLQQEIFDYCVSESKKQIYSDYGDAWHDFMTIIVSLTDSEERMEAIFKVLDKKLNTIPKNGSWSNNYEIEKITKIKYKILLVHQPKQAAQLVEDNIHFSSFRTAAIKNAFEKGDYETVRKLAEDGIKHDQKNAPGLLKDWKNWLYKIALKTDDKKLALEQAADFFKAGRGGMEDFYRLKKHYPKEKWDEKVSQILKERSGNQGWYGNGTTHDICVEEQRWDILKKNLANVTRFDILKEYGKYIVTHFDKETLRDMYVKVVNYQLKNTSGRSAYQEACRGIRQMKPLADKEYIETLITSLKTQYPNRRAMIEELNKV